MKAITIQLLALAATLLASASPALPQEEPRTLESCIEQALQKNIRIQQTGLNNQISGINADQAQADRFPSVSGSVRQDVGWSTETDALTGTDSFKGSSGTSASFSSSVVLYNGRRLTNSIRQAQLEYEAGKMDLEALKETISLSVMDAYLQILYAGEQVTNATHQTEVTESELRLAAERLALSAISKAEYLQIQSQLANEKLMLANAENLLAINKLTLMQLMEQPAGDAFTIAAPDLSGLINRQQTPNPDSIYRIALSIKPQIAGYRIREESAAIGIDLAKSGYYPKLSADAGLGTTYRSLTQNATLSEQLGKNINPSIGLSLSIPIYSNQRTRNQVQIARLATQNAALDLKNSENELRKAVEQACTNVSSAQKEYEASREQFRSNEEAFAVAAEKFRQGMINSVDYLFQKTSLITAESQLLQSTYNLIFRYKLLDFYTGVSLSL
jgi:outer membrane protein